MNDIDRAKLIDSLIGNRGMVPDQAKAIIEEVLAWYGQTDDAQTLSAIVVAVTRYHEALDDHRLGPGVAAAALVRDVEAAMGMPWVQGRPDYTESVAAGWHSIRVGISGDIAAGGCEYLTLHAWGKRNDHIWAAGPCSVRFGGDLLDDIVALYYRNGEPKRLMDLISDKRITLRAYGEQWLIERGCPAPIARQLMCRSAKPVTAPGDLEAATYAH